MSIIKYQCNDNLLHFGAMFWFRLKNIFKIVLFKIFFDISIFRRLALRARRLFFAGSRFSSSVGVTKNTVQKRKTYREREREKLRDQKFTRKNYERIFGPKLGDIVLFGAKRRKRREAPKYEKEKISGRETVGFSSPLEKKWGETPPHRKILIYISVMSRIFLVNF